MRFRDLIFAIKNRAGLEPKSSLPTDTTIVHASPSRRSRSTFGITDGSINTATPTRSNETARKVRTRVFIRLPVWLACACVVGLISSCATDDGTRLGSEPDTSSTTSNADPASYGADAFTFRKKQFVHGPNDFMFYYKHCNLTGEHTYYSRTDYACSEP